jgi:hypothetical protein
VIVLVIGLIAVALVFDFINGFHDAANSIATVVSTRVLSPGTAVIWAADNVELTTVAGTAVCLPNRPLGLTNRNWQRVSLACKPVINPVPVTRTVLISLDANPCSGKTKRG